MSECTRIEFAARDGLTLRGDFYKADGEGVPVAVMATGFSLLKETNAGFAQAIQQAGISVLAFDYRTFGSSDGMPRQEIDLYRQVEDFSDAVTAARALPDVDPNRVIMWGVGHGASNAMIAAASDPRPQAVVLHVPFPSGSVDAQGFPKGLLDRAWADLEQKAIVRDTSPTYAKVWRDWERDGDGDEDTVFIKGPAAFGFYSGILADTARTGTPWKNEVTLRSFLNVAGTEAQDFAYRITRPTIYVVNENDPLAPSTEVQRAVFETMGANAEWHLVPATKSGDLGEQLGAGLELILDWVKRTV